ncbi:hypothetical protein CsSME_00017205 [Camellia sinensis var. sinensis]
MEAVAKLHHRHQPLHLSLHHDRPSFSKPIYSLSFPTPPPPSSPSLKSSSAPQTPKPQFTKTLNPFPFSFLKTTLISAVAAAAVFSNRFNLKPVIAATPPPAAAAEEAEKSLEDVQALRDLMEAKVNNGKVDEAISIAEQLMRLEPNDMEWPLLKAHMHCYNGELEMAKLGFNEILDKDSLLVEAYHGLVMAVPEGDLGLELKEIEKRVGEAMEICKREKKEEVLRDFKLLIAQIRVIEENYSDALKVYQELVNEEPRDFRPYLCQGIIYTLLRKKDEAAKQFQKYRMLVPEGHPYAQYFNDNMVANKDFGQMLGNERVGSKS